MKARGREDEGACLRRAEILRGFWLPAPKRIQELHVAETTSSQHGLRPMDDLLQASPSSDNEMKAIKRMYGQSG